LALTARIKRVKEYEMRKLLFAAAAFSTLALAASAQQPGGPPPPNGGPPGPHRMFEDADANKDGVVTRAEFDANQKAMFARMNDKRGEKGDRKGPSHGGGKMGDGRGRGPGGPHLFIMRCEGGPVDANKDGKISRDEFLAGPLAAFAKMDANKDGFLSEEEQPKHGPGFGPPGRGPEGRDMKGDHKPPTQADFLKRGGEMFDHLDANHDGKLTKAETEAPPRCD
jgi:hypothetical protein